MLLAIDIGNTNVVLGVFENHTLRCRWRLDSNLRRSEDEWMVMMRSLFANEELKLSDIDGVAISSVVPSTTPVFTSIFQKSTDISTLLISCNLDVGLKIRYTDPSSVGADRLCNALAGYEMYGGPLIIIDLGTATTFDVISEKGDYLGGIISPGLETAAQYLHQSAAKLPSVELKFPEKIIATNTEQSIQAGIMFGTVASVEGVVERINKELGHDAFVVATGGLSNLFFKKIQVIKAYEPNLTLIGIEKIFTKVSKQTVQ
jgi:type III pantothenate kinase